MRGNGVAWNLLCSSSVEWFQVGELEKPGSLQGEATVAKEPWLGFL